MMLDLLSFLIFVFQANLLRRCEDGGGRLSASGTLIADYEQGLVHSTRSEQMDEILYPGKHPMEDEQMVSAGSNNLGGTDALPTLHAEQVLILLAKNGDRAAYTELYRLHAKTVFRTVLRITGNREDAEDVLQEASMKALIHLKGFDGRSKFSTWLTRIAINSALMMRRKKRNRIEMSIDQDYESGSGTTFQVPDQAPDPERRMHIAERDIHLNRAVKRLSTTLRKPLELQLKLDLSLNELAVELGISVPATKSRLLRAREKVRGSLMGSMRMRPAGHNAAISGLRPAQRARGI